jgi:hypothetical protein
MFKKVRLADGTARDSLLSYNVMVLMCQDARILTDIQCPLLDIFPL